MTQMNADDQERIHPNIVTDMICVHSSLDLDVAWTIRWMLFLFFHLRPSA
jgi:hypothetical protein